LVIAVYPGTFDPVTNGHIDIATRAARLFDTLIIGVYDETPKNVLFNTEERLAMMRDSVSGLENVSVQKYSGLTINFARSVGAKTIVRGLRAISDFEHEFQMAHMNRQLAPDIELVALMTSMHYAFLSSSIIKEVAALGGDVESLVPPAAANLLKRRFHYAKAMLSNR
jgi:pantetheine-phosphate adenylyltransferase